MGQLAQKVNAIIAGAAIAAGFTGCGSAVQKGTESPLNQNYLGVLNVPIRPPSSANQADPPTQIVQVSKDVRNLKTPQLLAKVDAEMGKDNSLYVEQLLTQLRSEGRCDRYVATLDHVMKSYPNMKPMCFEFINREWNARLGDKAERLLREFAWQRPEQAKVLAQTIAKSQGVPGTDIQIQKGFPEVAARMVANAHARLTGRLEPPYPYAVR